MFVFVVVIKAVHINLNCIVFPCLFDNNNNNKRQQFARMQSFSFSLPNVVVYLPNDNDFVSELLFLNSESVLHVRCTLHIVRRNKFQV